MIVADVNLVAYLLIEGEHTTTAEAVLRADAEWAAPMLWRSEWRSVLAGYLRRGELGYAAVLEMIDVAEAMLHGREHLVESDRVMHLVSRSTCSAYDCEYVALAEALDVPLVTADRQVLADFPSIAKSPKSFTG